jgi:hypothetical protein
MAIRHRHECYPGRFHSLGVVSLVRIFGSLSLKEDITIAPSKDSIAHECKNDGDAGDGNSANINIPISIPINIPINIPMGICRLSWQTLVAVFVISLLADLGFQVRKNYSPKSPWLLTFPIYHSSWTCVLTEDVCFLPQLALQEAVGKTTQQESPE